MSGWDENVVFISEIYDILIFVLNKPLRRRTFYWLAWYLD